MVLDERARPSNFIPQDICRFGHVRRPIRHCFVQSFEFLLWVEQCCLRPERSQAASPHIEDCGPSGTWDLYIAIYVRKRCILLGCNTPGDFKKRDHVGQFFCKCISENLRCKGEILRSLGWKSLWSHGKESHLRVHST